ncbi:hypothetical protein [Kitasatospora sp. LaBMicrA B282]|uniref:hypothetical protein n=1 Tax=Kitasatospora sp. LaBMicrA B282 TaxID=3420949 RepID=UPI003D141888
MSHLTTRRPTPIAGPGTRSLVLAAGAATAVAALAVIGGVALVDRAAPDSDAEPAAAAHAQVAAVIRPDGSVIRAHGLESVTKAGPGRYCLKLQQIPGLRLTDTVPVVSPYGAVTHPDTAALASTDPTPTCDAAPDTITVYTGTADRPERDAAFSLLIP